jgi:hypothetical protein
MEQEKLQELYEGARRHQNNSIKNQNKSLIELQQQTLQKNIQDELKL